MSDFIPEFFATYRYPKYFRYRVLRYLKPPYKPMRGEDVYALQTAINALNIPGLEPLVTDGVFGTATRRGTRKAQEFLGFPAEWVDAKAGGQTQRELCRAIIKNRTDSQLDGDGIDYDVLFLLETGQVSFESSNLVGNYSAERVDEDAEPGVSFDAGAAQRNSAHHDLSDAFNAEDSINLLITSTVNAWKRFSDTSRYRPHNDTPWLRRWKLAAGAWNAPAYANYYADWGGTANQAIPGPTAASKFEAYMSDAAVNLE